MIESFGSILDFVHPGLDQGVWDRSGKLKPEHKKLIETELAKLIEQHGFKESDTWIKQIKIVGSLTTYQYVSDADLDVHVIVDIDQFIKVNNPKLSEKEATDFLDDARKQLDEQKILLPNTKHNLELYFETPTSGVDPKASIYDVKEDKWIADPVSVKYDFDVEEMKPFIVDMANTIAGEMDESFGEIKRNIKRIEELQDVMKEWPKEQRKVFKTKLEDKLQAIEDEIKELLKTKKEILTERREKYQQLSEQEIKFKYLQKFGYFYIISQLEDILEEVKELTVEEVPEIKDVMKEAFMRHAYWIDPNGKVYEVRGGRKSNYTHDDWGWDNAKLLKDTYGITINLDRDLDWLTGILLENGWIRVGDSEFEGTWAVDVRSFRNISSSVEQLLVSFLRTNDEVEISTPMGEVVRLTYPWEGSLQKTVNKALSSPTKEAQYDKHEHMGKLCIDFDRTITDRDNHDDIGVPAEGVKEAFDKLKQDGWYIIIYSCRANDPKGMDDIKAFMDKYQLPYDEMFVGKPVAEFYIDDRNIVFTTWQDALKSVQKTSQLLLTARKVKIGNVWIGENKYLLVFVDNEYLDKYIDAILKIENIQEYGTGEYTKGIKQLDVFRTKSHDEAVKNALTSVKVNPDDYRDQVREMIADYAELIVSHKLDVRAYLEHAYWIDPKGKVYTVRGDKPSPNTHLDWIGENIEMLQREYGYNILEIKGTEDNTQGANFIVSDFLIRNGWVKIGDSQGSGWSVQLMSLQNIPTTVDNVLVQFLRDGDEVIIEDKSGNSVVVYYPWESSLQKDVNKNMSGPHKRRFSSKIAQQTAKYDFSSTQVDLPKDTAQQIVEWGVRNIPDEELWDDKTLRYGRELEPHVTVKYGILTNDVTEIKKVFEDEKPVKLKFGKTKFFKPEQYPHDVIVITVESDDLHKLNKKVSDNLKNEDLYPNYQPHATIAYVKEGLGKKYEGLEVLPTDLEVTIDSVLISPKEGDRSTIELKAAFYPSIVQAPDNPRQQDSDVEIPVDPDTISPEETYFAPQVDKPRKSIVERILEFFKSKPEKEAGVSPFEMWGIGYWIDPNGKLYDVRKAGGTHLGWIAQNEKILQSYGIRTHSYDGPIDGSIIYDEMIRSGWVRVGDSGGSQFGIQLNSLSEIPPAVENFVATHFKVGGTISIADFEEHMVEIADPTPSLQKAIKKELRLQKVHSFLKTATPPPVADYLRVHKQPMGATELMEFREQAPEDVQEEVDELIDSDKLKDAWVLIEKYLGRRHLKFADCDDCKKGTEPCDKCKKFYKPKTTWKNTEPFSPLQTTFTTTTNEENLNSRYPWKFMGKPKGPAYSNTNDVYEMIKGKKRISKKDKVASTFKFDPNSTQNQGRWRLRDPKEFEKMWTSHKQKDLEAPGLSFIVGTTKDGFGVQAIRFNKDQWDEEKAGKWWEEHKSKFTKTWTISDWTGYQTKVADSCYTNEDMEKIYDEQHEMHDSPDGSTQPHDWNQSTTDFPKPEDLEVYKVRLDLLQKPIDRTTPMIPSYEVTWQFGLPQDQSEAFDE